MKRILLISIVFSTMAACSAGPMHLTHNEGELPKFYMDTGMSDCKVKAKNDGGFAIEQVDFRCKWSFN